MKNLQQVLNELGDPPQELCLDWAWQLHDLVQKSPNSPSQNVSWENLQIGEDGRLQLPEALEPQQAEELILDLFDTAGIQLDARQDLNEERDDRQASPDKLSPGVLQQLQNLTLQAVSSASSDTDASQDRFELDRQVGTRSKARRDGRAVNSKTAFAKISQNKLGLASLAAAAILLVSPLLWYLHANSAATRNGTTVASSQNLAEASSSQAESRPGRATEESLPEELEELSNFEDRSLAAEVGSEFGFIEPDPLANLKSEASFDGVFHAVRSEADVEEVDEDAKTDGDLASSLNRGPEGEQDAKPEASEASPLPADPAEQVDVMAELADVARDAEAQVRESELGSSDAGAQQLEPFRLPTVPMMQVQKLPRKMVARTREPAWQLRIETSEGFEVQPNSAQTIRQRDSARWVIQLEDGDEEAVQLYVMAEMVGSGGKSIRWRIGVGAADIPRLVLPLGQQYLDRLQANLAGYQIRLQASINRLEAMNNLPGMQGAARTALRNQRKQLEGQLKLATRVLQIVAQASQLEGWLDGQLEIHAAYRDEAQPDSPALLQFGSISSKDNAEDVAGDAMERAADADRADRADGADSEPKSGHENGAVEPQDSPPKQDDAA